MLKVIGVILAMLLVRVLFPSSAAGLMVFGFAVWVLASPTLRRQVLR
jgi:hypothetical protein